MLYPRFSAACSAGTCMAFRNVLSHGNWPGLSVGLVIVITPGSLTVQPENWFRDAVRIHVLTPPVMASASPSDVAPVAPAHVILIRRAFCCPVAGVAYAD